MIVRCPRHALHPSRPAHENLDCRFPIRRQEPRPPVSEQHFRRLYLAFRAAGAVRADEWVANVKDVFFHEISERLKEPRQSFPSGQNWKGIIEVHDGDALVGLAFVTLSHDAAVPYGIIEDIVVDKSRRSGGLGEQIMRWIFAQMEAAGIRRQFLESGIGNESAHHLFERLGFKTVSVVMMRDG
ncbi:MAG: hypothetical protein DPW22_10750 [Alphaproteobacteria bacterium]|nr:hypothetical protein [Alphaproteobacteria bacterium]